MRHLSIWLVQVVTPTAIYLVWQLVYFIIVQVGQHSLDLMAASLFIYSCSPSPLLTGSAS